MKTIRIFISSPGDVQEERARARQVIEGLRRRYAGVFHLKPVLWEELPLQPDLNFQQGIDAALLREGLDIIDIAIFILWSRLGSPTGPLVVRKDGTPYRSGTEREYDLMISARMRSKEKEGRARPDILVYTRRDEASFDERLRGKSTSEKEKEIGQKKLIETFIAEEFKDAETGSYFGAYHNFDLPTTFSKRLREHLTKLLDELAGGEFAETIWDVEKQGPPFLGLASFQPEHADVFFGREDEVLEARLALSTHAREGCAFLLITGASGCGKSSLARAGLLPAIAEHELDETITEWRSLVVSPSELASDPVASLLERLASPSLLPGLRSEGVTFEEVVASFRKDASTATILLKQAVAAASIARKGGVRMLLLIDQLEEIFTMPDRSSFLTLVEALARSGAVWIVATIRSDFLGEAHRDPVLARLVEGRPTLGLLPPSADALCRMIQEPARLAGLVFEERGGRRLGERILADAAKHADLLPLVEFVLLRLYETRDGRNVLSWKSYEEQLGGVEGALRRRADEIFNVLSPEVQASLPQVLKRLVTVPETGEKSEEGANRFIRQWADLDLFTKDSPVRTLVDALVAARLLTASSESEAGGEARITVAHEALLRVWPRASAWAEGNRDLLRTRARVAGRMGESGVIAEGDPLLAAAWRYLEEDREAFDEAQAAFVEQSVRMADENRQRRERTRRAVVVGMAVLTLLTSGAAVWGWRSQRVAKQAEARTEAQLKETQRQLERSTLEEGRAWLERARTAEKEKNPFLAIMLAGRAVGFRGYGWREEDEERFGKDYPALLARGFEDHEIESARLAEVEQVRQLIDRQTPTGLLLWSSPDPSHHRDPVQCVAFSPDGTRLVSGGGTTLKLWDAATGKELSTFSGHTAKITGVAFSPDGARIASGAHDKIVKFWDAGSGKELATLSGHIDSVTCVAFSPDGKRIASGSEDHTVKLWDAATGKEVATLSLEASVTSLAFSPDGTCIASASGHTVRLSDSSSGKGLATLSLDTSVTSVTFSPDGTQLASGSGSSVQLWNASSGRKRATLSDHRNSVTSVAFSPDGTRVASGFESLDDTVKLWDVASGRVLVTLRGHGGSVTCVAFSPDGTRIASGSEDHTVKFWDAATGKELAPDSGHKDSVTSVAFSRDGMRIASGSEDHTVKLWDVGSGKELATLSGHKDSVTSVAFSPDGTRIASGSGANDGTLKLWDAASGKELATLSDSIVTSLGFSPDGTRIASGTGSLDCAVKLWDATSGKELATLLGHDDYVTSVSFSPDGTRIASGSYDATVKIWDANSGKELATLSGHKDSVTSIAFSPDGTRLLSGAGEEKDRTLKLWETATGKELATFSGHTRSGHNTAFVTSVAFSPDGTWIASGAVDGTVKLWDAASGEDRAILSGHSDSVNSVAFSPDGARLASGSSDGTVKLWHATGGRELATFSVHTLAVGSVAFSPDGTRLASGSWDGVKIWETASGNELATLADYAGHDSHGVAFSPDGTRIAATVGDTVKLWETASGRQLTPLSGHTLYINSMAFNSDGTRIASGSADRTVRLWETATGRELATLSGEDVRSLAFSPDGTRIASGAGEYDGYKLKLWDLASGRELATLSGHTSFVNSVAFSPDGTRLASGSWDDTVRLWDVSSGKELATIPQTTSVTSVAFSRDGTRIVAGLTDDTVKIWDTNSGKELADPPDYSLLGDNYAVTIAGQVRAVANDRKIQLELTAPFLPDLMALQRQSVYYLEGRELRFPANQSLVSKETFAPLIVRHDEFAELANSKIGISRRRQLQMQLLAKGSQWHAAIAMWTTVQNPSSEERSIYLTFLLSQALTDLRNETAPSLPLLLPAITSALDAPTAADPRVSLPLIRVLIHFPDSPHYQPNQAAYKALHLAALANLPAHLRVSVEFSYGPE